MGALALVLVLDLFYGCLCNLHWPEEVRLKNVRQLTYGGINALATFSPDGRSVLYQAQGRRYASYCDQVYQMELGISFEQQIAHRLSSGIGACTRATFYPDGRRVLYAGTFDLPKDRPHPVANSCPVKVCKSHKIHIDPVLKKLCRQYTWDLYPTYNLFEVNEFGNVLNELTSTDGYDAESSISPDGSKIVFTSMRSGDPEIWIMDVNGSNPVQLTHEMGYDGGASFSPDGKKIVYRGSRPQTESEIQIYKLLLSYNLVSPLSMELFTMNVDGTDRKQLTHLGGSSWSPIYTPDGKNVMFTSNYDKIGTCGVFSIFKLELETMNIEQITFSPGGFDAFPMFNRMGTHFMWSSSRNGITATEINIFVAEWDYEAVGVKVERIKRAAPSTDR